LRTIEPSPDAPLVAIVDDDPSVRQSARRLLVSLGRRVEVFGSAEEFLASGRAPATACLILDVRMPGTDGLGLQRLLADAGLVIPTVFITGRASEDEERRALHAGAIAFLRKPVNKAALVRVLDDVLGKPASGGGTHDDQ
jgi:FixJ family two-component response regulator